MPSDCVTIWTRFQVPKTVDLFNVIQQNCEANLKIENSHTWYQGLEALTKASGHVISIWGRIIERPDEIQLVTTWETKNAVSAFESSPAYGIYYSAITLYGPPTTPLRVAFYGIEFMFHQFPEYVHMRTVYFPTPITEEQRLSVMKITSLLDPSRAGGDFGNRRGRVQPGPWKQWVEGEHEFERQPVESFLNLYFWKDSEAEVNFMTNHMETIMEQAVGEDGNTHTVYGERLLSVDIWERRLKAAGAVGWVDEHCELRQVPCGKWILDNFDADKSQQSVVLPKTNPESIEQIRERLKKHNNRRKIR